MGIGIGAGFESPDGQFMFQFVAICSFKSSSCWIGRGQPNAARIMSLVQPAQQMYLRGSSIEIERLSPLRSCPSSAQDGQRVTLFCPTVRSLVATWSRMWKHGPPVGLHLTGSAFGSGVRAFLI